MSMKIEEWRGIIADCKESGLPQREYCKTKNLSFPTFSCWRTKINKMRTPAHHDDSASFVRHSFPSINNAAFVLEWPDGMRLKMSSNLSHEDLTDLVHRLRTDH